MKKKKLLVILSIIEIVLVLVFIYSYYISIKVSVALSFAGITSSWINNGSVLVSESDKFFIKLSNILPYIIILIMITRFIFIDKKKKIALGLSILSFLLFLGCFSSAFEIIRLIGLVFIILAIGLYIYSHFIDTKDESLVFKKK